MQSINKPFETAWGGGSNKKIIKNFTFSDGLQVGLFRGIVRLRHITLQAVVK